MLQQNKFTYTAVFQSLFEICKETETDIVIYCWKEKPFLQQKKLTFMKACQFTPDNHPYLQVRR